MTLLLGSGGERGRGRRSDLVPVSDGDFSTCRIRVGGRARVAEKTILAVFLEGM